LLNLNDVGMTFEIFENDIKNPKRDRLRLTEHHNIPSFGDIMNALGKDRGLKYMAGKYAMFRKSGIIFIKNDEEYMELRIGSKIRASRLERIVGAGKCALDLLEVELNGVKLASIEKEVRKFKKVLVGW
jgi:hypothetical protein